MLNDHVDELCHQHTCWGILRSAAQWIIKIRLFPSTVSLSRRPPQYCRATLMLNGSHTLSNPGYTGKKQYSRGGWVKHIDITRAFLSWSWVVYLLLKVTVLQQQRLYAFRAQDFNKIAAIVYCKAVLIYIYIYIHRGRQSNCAAIQSFQALKFNACRGKNPQHLVTKTNFSAGNRDQRGQKKMIPVGLIMLHLDKCVNMQLFASTLSRSPFHRE